MGYTLNSILGDFSKVDRSNFLLAIEHVDNPVCGTVSEGDGLPVETFANEMFATLILDSAAVADHADDVRMVIFNRW